jgi:hypothetical protein
MSGVVTVGGHPMDEIFHEGVKCSTTDEQRVDDHRQANMNNKIMTCITAPT